MIKAIETVYKGYRFRSRLEVRWAVFFDTLGLAWRYEAEGFEFGAAGRYLPDFWLDDLRLWVEIKPNMPGASDLRRLAALAEGLPGNALLLMGEPGQPTNSGDDYGYWWKWPYSGKIFIGDYPNIAPILDDFRLNYTLESLPEFLRQRITEGVIQSETVPDFDGTQAALCRLIDLDRQYFRARYKREHDMWIYGCAPDQLAWAQKKDGSFDFLPAGGNDRADSLTPGLLSAYKAARGARFEHGENGEYYGS